MKLRDYTSLPIIKLFRKLKKKCKNPKEKLQRLSIFTLKYTYIGGCLTLGYYGFQTLLWLTLKIL